MRRKRKADFRAVLDRINDPKLCLIRLYDGKASSWCEEPKDHQGRHFAWNIWWDDGSGPNNGVRPIDLSYYIAWGGPPSADEVKHARKELEWVLQATA